MLAGLNSYGNTRITETIRSRDHTENLLMKNSQAIKINNREKKINVWQKIFKSINLNIGGDPSSAAFTTLHC